MSEITFGNCIIDDPEAVLKYLSQMSKIQNIDLDDVIEFIQTEESTKFYLDKTITGCEEKDATYVWLDSGFTDERKQPLFISLLNHHGFFSGHIVGSAYSLSQSIADHFKIQEHMRRAKYERFLQKYERKTEKRSAKTLNEIYIATTNTSTEKIDESNSINNAPSETLIKKYWNNKQVLDITKDVASQIIINKWHSIEGLDRYIKVIGSRLAQLVKAGKMQYFVLNKIRSAICNTGLLNHFGEDVYILYRMNLSYNFYTPYKIIMDKTQYLEEGFTKEQTAHQLEPITFFDSTNHGFNVQLEDINLTSMTGFISFKSVARGFRTIFGTYRTSL